VDLIYDIRESIDWGLFTTNGFLGIEIAYYQRLFRHLPRNLTYAAWLEHDVRRLCLTFYYLAAVLQVSCTAPNGSGVVPTVMKNNISAFVLPLVNNLPGYSLIAPMFSPANERQSSVHCPSTRKGRKFLSYGHHRLQVCHDGLFLFLITTPYTCDFLEAPN